MQDNSNARQLIVERIKQSTNILVTVNSNPSVDALSAALALTLLINKLDKHGAAVFSGAVPPAINFLEPSKTFEHDVDSLRDFIIALDKEKADRLRYKVEDDVVKIFITPYRTTITEKDLQFSQGDFNVDLIIALGVIKREDLDRAIIAHGRILHDATVVTVNAAQQKSTLGSIDWNDGRASSLSEMLAGIADTLKPGLLDQQISTALLTGIVAATERFSNQHTTPQVMTTAAQLMAAGANQQLIAANLQMTQPMPSTSAKIVKEATAEPLPVAAARPDGEMQIEHPKVSVPKPIAFAEPPRVAVQETEPEIPVAPPPAAAFGELKEAIEAETAKETPAPTLVTHEMLPEEPPKPPKASAAFSSAVAEEEEPKPEPEARYLVGGPSWRGKTIQPPEAPSLGGALSATAEQALEDKLRSEQEDKNKKILTHGGPAVAEQEKVPQPAPQEVTATVLPPVIETAPLPTPTALPSTEPAQIESPTPVLPSVEPEPTVPTPELPRQTIEQLEQEVAQTQKAAEAPVSPQAEAEADLLAARAAVNEALEAMPAANEPREAVGTQALPPVSSAPPAPAGLPEIGQLPPLPPQNTGANQPGLPPLPPLPPMPDFSQLPSLPPLPTEPTPSPVPQLPPLPEVPVQPAPGPIDPKQYRIPGQ